MVQNLLEIRLAQGLDKNIELNKEYISILRHYWEISRALLHHSGKPLYTTVPYLIMLA